jgi:hypothetical protein
MYPSIGSRNRDLSRVKDYPSGNASSSVSRMAFLQSLCKIEKYLCLVDKVAPVVRTLLFWFIIFVQ